MEKGVKGFHLSKVKMLQETRDPTEVENHLKAVAIALHADGYGDEVNILDPRTGFKAYRAPEYDATKNGMSNAALSAMEPAERVKAVRNWIEKFEIERQRKDDLCRENEKKLYHPLQSTLSPSSLGRVTSHGIRLHEKAETSRDVFYLVETVIKTHSASVTTGLSVIATQQLVMTRVAAYMSCSQGQTSLDSYLERMNDHVKAIRSMDKLVDPNTGEGGYLGSKADQVARYLLGTGATVIINHHMNGTLARIPRSFEDVNMLIKNWAGRLTEHGETRPTTNILHTEEQADEAVYGISSHGDPKGKSTKSGGRSKTPETKAEWAQRKKNANDDCQKRGLELPYTDKNWTGNPGAPRFDPPLRSTEASTTTEDRTPCFNCFRFHPHPRTNLTTWVNCDKPWDLRCYERHLMWKARTEKKRVTTAQPV
jgi:hypothetical protein